MIDKWISKGLYEHPAKHNAGTYGDVGLAGQERRCAAAMKTIINCLQTNERRAK